MTKRAFTLVEILVVILIIGLLFVILIPRLDISTTKAREAGVKTDFRSYQMAFEAVAREQSGLGQGALGVTEKEEVAKMINVYLDSELHISESDGIKTNKKDPWNKEYEFYWHGTSGNDGIAMLISGGMDETLTSKSNPTGTTINLGTPSSGMVATLRGIDTDDYAIGTSYEAGVIKTITSGFTTNIE